MSHQILRDFAKGKALSFDEMCVSALRVLKEKLDFGLWMVTRTDGDDWVVLKAADRDYGVQDGDVFVWMESFCSRMVKGLGPTFAPESDAVVAYAQAEIGRKIPIKAYMGFPMLDEKGELIGTLCAIDPSPVPSNWSQYTGLVEEIAAELAVAYRSDYKQAIESAKAREANAISNDQVLMLLSHDWDSLVDANEAMAVTTGRAISVIVTKIDDGSRHDRELNQTLHRIVGRDNFVVYQGNNLYALLLLDCNAPKLEAYVELLRASLDSLQIKHLLGYGVRSESYGLNHAYDQALGRVFAQELRLRAA